ncbi:MAG: pyridoxal phosphate-dependent aminotransferase [Methanobacteriota archaeon]|nr:MAG: pyridoxal phosphate-dependent aminotransferase [Euryarchaeota archaeon]
MEEAYFVLQERRVSQFLGSVVGSVTAEIFAQAKLLQRQGKSIINLAIGQPDFLPPNEVLSTASRAILEGNVRYAESKGIYELRKAVTDYYGLPLDVENEVVITTGAKMGIFASIWTVCNPGDNVVILDPSWVSYGSIVKSLGCEPRYVETGPDFVFDEEDLIRKIDGRTKAVIVNTPSNPTGQIIGQTQFQRIFELCASNEILLVSDEIYNEYVFGSKKFTSLGSIKNWKEHGVIVNGFSKTFSMTGFRLGYTLSNEVIAKEINKVMQLTASCASPFAQLAGISGLEHIDDMRERIQTIMKPRLKRLIELDEELEGFKLLPPQGAMYGWFQLDGKVESAKWAQQLLSEKGVAVTPGIGFGPHGEGWFRVSFATDPRVLEEGLRKIEEFVRGI